MRQRVFVPILVVGLLAACGWGYSQYQKRMQWEINAENQYQRAFEELAAHANNMESELTKSLVAASFPQTMRLLTNVWREANSCQESLGQLPLTSLDLSKTKMFLAKASTFCFNTAQEKLIKGTEIDDKEWETLQQFRDQCRLVTKQLTDLQQKFFNERANWLEVARVGTAAAAGLANGLNNNKVTKSFLMLEDGLRRVPDVEFEGNNLDFEPKPTGLTGEKLTPEQCKEKLRKFLGPEYQNANIKYERTIKGGFTSYMFLVTDPKNSKHELRCSVSQKGGHVAWVLGNRLVQDSKLSLAECAAKAEAFCERNGYPNMKTVSKESFENVTTCTLVPERNGVLYYPELIKVQVAQDNGDILGCDAINYLTFNEPAAAAATSIKPKITRERLQQLISPRLKVERIQVAQVLDEMYNKVTCYEVAGTQGGDRFLIYYNATTGKEEKIRRVDENGNEIM
ncbi:MAG TPA: germination protein YpeB [Bacillota bacterium]|nr:germination protein YpeB [Bacillota bacterium]HPT86261.1 germination protein YpeB [Bacillota bacterium]